MFIYHSKETAPAESAPLIDQSVATFAFLPKLHQILAEAPATYETYNKAFALFQSNTTLTPLEQQIVMMTANYENRCHYCTAGHSLIMTLQKMPAEIIAALRDGEKLRDPKLQALQSFARDLLDKRGHIGDAAYRNSWRPDTRGARRWKS